MIQFPRAMPTVGAIGIEFEPERVDYLAGEAGGALGAMSAGFPRWRMKIDLGAMRMVDADQWRAWLAVQRGPQRPFFGFDIDRQMPGEHRRGRPYRPTPAGWAQAIGADGLAVLTLNGLLSGQVVAIGDYVGFSWGGGQLALTRAVETRAAGAGGTVSVAVEPPLPPIVPGGAAVTLRRAGCLMRLVPGETKLAGSGLNTYTAGSTIVAVQDLYG